MCLAHGRHVWRAVLVDSIFLKNLRHEGVLQRIIIAPCIDQSLPCLRSIVVVVVLELGHLIVGLLERFDLVLVVGVNGALSLGALASGEVSAYLHLTLDVGGTV